MGVPAHGGDDTVVAAAVAMLLLSEMNTRLEAAS